MAHIFILATLNYLGINVRPTLETFHTLPDRNAFWQLFKISKMATKRSFIGPPLFFTGPPTFSSVVGWPLTSFTESGKMLFKVLHKHGKYKIKMYLYLHVFPMELLMLALIDIFIYPVQLTVYNSTLFNLIVFILLSSWNIYIIVHGKHFFFMIFILTYVLWLLSFTVMR